MLIANGNNSQQHWNPVALLVAQLDSGFPPFSVIYCLFEGACRATQHAAFVVTMEKDILAGWTSNNVVTMIASDPLRPIIPEDDLPVAVDHINSGLETIQNNPKDLWSLKFRHSGLYRNFIGKPSVYFRLLRSSGGFRVCVAA
jgi:hypothetical protein